MLLEKVYRKITKLRRLNLTEEEFDAAVAASNGRCAICEQPRRLVADLGQTTRKFRGFICNACKTGLSMFKDSPETLAVAIQYLQKANYE